MWLWTCLIPSALSGTNWALAEGKLLGWEDCGVWQGCALRGYSIRSDAPSVCTAGPVLLDPCAERSLVSIGQTTACGPHLAHCLFYRVRLEHCHGTHVLVSYLCLFVCYKGRGNYAHKAENIYALTPCRKIRWPLLQTKQLGSIFHHIEDSIGAHIIFIRIAKK